MPIEIGDKDADHFCWCIMTFREETYHPDDVAERSGADVDDVEGVKTFSNPNFRYGFFRGKYEAWDNAVARLALKGVDVVGRAERYDRALKESNNEYTTYDFHGLAEHLGHRANQIEEVDTEDIDPDPPYEVNY